MLKLNIAFLACLALIGCSDTFLSSVPPAPSPEIEITPLEYNFGNIDVGEVKLKTFTILNVGTEDLVISNIELTNDDQGFMLGSYDSVISPDESTDLSVTYLPTTYDSAFDILSISSNDEDESVILVPLRGSGSAPIISISPWIYSYGSSEIGCESIKEFQIRNIGNRDLNIDNIIYNSNIPSDFYPESFYNLNGNFPWTIIPGENIPISISYIPSDIQSDNGFLNVFSSDPLTPIAIAAQSGDGTYGSFTTDSFEQSETNDVDILFVIDNSGSMIQNQMNFKDNFNSFISAFHTAGIDYHIGFITTDSKELASGAIISNSTIDPVTEVNNIVDTISIFGSPSEMGLLYSYLATQPGEWAERGGQFMRDDAKLVVIYLSDERDHSDPYVSIPQLKNHFIGLKGSLSMVTAHAVAGDYPAGCSGNGNADFGDGYYDLVNELNGTFLSICSDIWGEQMDLLARNSLLNASFPLSEQPVVSSIEASVDGIVDYNWTYEASTNSVIFSSPPADSAIIDISYAIYSECY